LAYRYLCIPLPLPPNPRIISHEQSIDKLTAVWLLPVVAPIVAAATGGNLCTVIENSTTLHNVLVASYVLWGIGVPFAMSILVLYIHRLTVYNVCSQPQKNLNSSFLQMKSLSVRSSPLVHLAKVGLESFNSGSLPTTSTGSRNPLASSFMALVCSSG